ncbi:14891_t:CDS:1, partial [Gigaspora margarita]
NEVDPLLWWQEKQREYPRLSLIAKDYLCIQATSVASEQAFSIAGQTITASRNRLDGEVARVVLCLKSWIQEKIS